MYRPLLSQWYYTNFERKKVFAEMVYHPGGDGGEGGGGGVVQYGYNSAK